jgi:hypothetical protein
MNRLEELANNIPRAHNELGQIEISLSEARQQGRSQDTMDNLSREFRDAQVELLEAMRARRKEMDCQNARMEFALI